VLNVDAQAQEGIFRQSWPTPATARAAVVIAHGAGEHSGRYEHVAQRLTGAGYATYALDHHGHGRSEGKPALLEMDRAVGDLRSLINDVRGEDPERPVFLLGHSMGGCVSLVYACRYQEEIDGLILSSPLAALQAASAPMRIASKALGAVAPGLGVYAVPTEMISHDPEVVRAYEEDPLVFHGKLPARTIAELTRAIEAFPEEVPSLTLPLLVFHGSADEITPVEGSEMVFEEAASTDKTLRIFDGLYHETMNEPEQDQVLELVVGWLDERT
jgi:alpha-beta hydrolase superfamily lysophospholipase